MSNSQKNLETTSGIITAVERYYKGLILTLGKGRGRKRKVYINPLLLRQKLGTSILQLSDYERFVNLAGYRINATGIYESWYGGKHRSFLKALDFTIEETNLTELIKQAERKEEKEKRIRKILSEVLRSSKESEKFVEKLKKIEETIMTNPPKDVPFPVCFTLFKLITGRKILPPGALAPVLRYFMKEAYTKEGKISLRYSEVKDWASCFFLQLPDVESARNLVKGEFYAIDTENDFYFTNWEYYSTLKKTITYLFEVTGKEKNPDEIKKVIDNVITEGKYTDGKNSMIIRLKVLPLILTKTILDDKKILFITGEAGAGKTTFLKEFAEYLTEEGKKVHKCALTGGAASEVEGETIAYTNKHGIPPAVEYVLIDEAGTIDLITFSKLIDQIRNKKVVLCGDPERQTPPPAGYEVIKNLVLPFLSDHCVLVAGGTYRFDKENAKVVLVPVEMKVSYIEPFLRVIIPFLESKRLSWFITTVIHREDAGTIKLNKLAKAILGRNPEELEEEDRVILKKNIKIGNRIIEGNKASAVIEKIHEDGKITIRGLKSGRTLTVDRNDLAPGYAFEVYNAQGKEADCVISFIPKYFPDSDGNFERRLEVALTRARKLTFLFVSPYVLKHRDFTDQFYRVTKDRFRIKRLTTTDEIKKLLLETFAEI